MSVLVSAVNPVTENAYVQTKRIVGKLDADMADYGDDVVIK